MRLIIDIPDYNLNAVQNGSIACGQILKAVRNGIPYKEATLNEYEGHWHCDNCGLITKKTLSDIYDYTPRFCSRCGCHFSEIKKER